jgi:peptide/nickel transport system substrate-binding protein
MRTRLLTAGLLALAMLLASCSGTAPNAAAPVSTTFTYANNLEVMTSWDPATGYSNEVLAMNNIYEQLTRYDSATGKVVPLLAESWTTSPDGLSWTFKLRQGVTFSTGKPMDAAAAKAALDRTIKLGGGAAYEWSAVKKITATDASTLTFDLSYAAPLDLVASSAYAAYIYDTTAVSGDLAAWFEEGHTAGTGPYVVDSWKKGQENELTLKANADYWGGWSGEHYKQVIFRIVPQETTAAQLLQSGQVNFVPRLSPSLFKSLSTDDKIQTVETSSFQNILAMLNTASGPLVDLKLRQAVSEAIDYDGIVTALQGSVVKAQGVVPEGLLGYTTDVSQTTDTAAAQQLLTDAGYGPGGKKLSLTLTYASGTPELDTIVTLMKSNLAKVGITLDAKALAWETQWAIGKSADPSKRQDIFLFYWYPDYADPFSWFYNLYRSADPVVFNLSYWNDPTVDKTIDGIQAVTATDRPKAQDQYVQLQKTVSDQAISPVLGVQNYQRAYLSTVSGYVDNPSYSNVVFFHELTPTS